MPQHEPTLGDEKNERLEIMRGMIFRGMSQAEIVKAIQDDPKTYPWKLSARQLRNYYKECWETFGKDAVNIDRAAWFTYVLEGYDDEYRSAKKAGDRRWTHANLQSIHHLLKLDQPAAKLDWRDVLKKAGIDPQSAVEQFAAMFNKDDDATEQTG